MRNKQEKITLDREQVLHAVQGRQWDTILTWLHQQKEAIKRDAHLQFAADVFTGEFLRFLPGYAVDRADVRDYSERLALLHWGRMYTLPDEQYRLLIAQLALRTQSSNLEQAYHIAVKAPNEDVCQQIIAAYESQLPQQVKHSQSRSIQVTEAPAAPSAVQHDCRIPLFKSYQEKQLFQGLKQALPAFHVYPNVAISCLLDWENLREQLTPVERNFFFKGIVDFVVFDQARDYLPVYFFELDSLWHDSDAAQRRDEAKDGIFVKAGLRLLRIRKLEQQISESEFTEMVRELIREL